MQPRATPFDEYQDLDFSRELDRLEQQAGRPFDSSLLDGDDEMETKKPRKLTNGSGVHAAVEGFSAKALAKELGMSGTILRRALRDLKVKKPGKRWVWSKKTHPDVERIRKELGKSKKPAKKVEASASAK